MNKTVESKSILTNATPLLSNVTGVGQVILEISKRLERMPALRLSLYTPVKTYSTASDIISQNQGITLKSLKRIKSCFRYIPFKSTIRKLYFSYPKEQNTYDIYWEPNFIPLPTISAKNIITTVHDMSCHEHPEWHPEERVSFFNKYFFDNITRSNLVVTVSKNSRDCLLNSKATINENQVRVIPCGVDHHQFKKYPIEEVERFKDKYRLPSDFILFVGTIEPRKNLENLLNAYAILPKELQDRYPLILIGDRGWKNKSIRELIVKIGNNVRLMGYLKNRDELALMYNAATVFVYPSIYEGFGIPPLEAMSCGTPVCLSDIPVFREIYGNNVAQYFDPLNYESICGSLTTLLSNVKRRDDLIMKGMILCKEYSWDRAADKYIQLFDEIS